MKIKYLLEKYFNYRGRHPTNTDSKLIWMSLKDHFRDPEKFKEMLNNRLPGEPHFIEGHTLKLHPDIKKRYQNIIYSFTHRVPGYPNAKGYFTKTKSKPTLSHINLSHFDSLSSEFLENNHFRDIHDKFLKELSSRYPHFRHEIQHYDDFIYSDPNDSPVGSTNQEYFNAPSEVNAHIAEKEHHIERTLLQNRAINREYNPLSYDLLPLRKRLYHYRNNPFVDKLHIINSHTLENFHTPHHVWFNFLTPENQKRVEKSLSPLINKYMIPN